MADEYKNLLENKMWVLVPPRQVGDGRSQQVGIKFHEIFSPVVKPATIYTVLSIVVSSSVSLRQKLLALLSREFVIMDLGPLHSFLGLLVSLTNQGLFLDQKTCAHDIVSCAGMTSCNPVLIPIDTQGKLSSQNGKPCHYQTLYHSLAGAL
ncbi:uncharacterized mitochondrial protein AtMg00810-like [Rutidosis leptorrhynchoides]|uniref:uncharacterized mitochondrial protein AtMg00810-like n=1 Tax=Rutidosis leptorrhynchoides TaxID=125765 RepID=UPI003A996F2B